ncbi:hypothetical protein CK221_04025 [Mesorhizobium sp. WSM3868]|nr:hypothetical protein CK221_04025 [Mesorhizobium sp. WSM3868]
MKLPISPLEGEMSPKATEGVGPTGLGLRLQNQAGAPCEMTPSSLPAISPSRGEISCHTGPRLLPTLQEWRGAEVANLPP